MDRALVYGRRTHKQLNQSINCLRAAIQINDIEYASVDLVCLSAKDSISIALGCCRRIRDPNPAKRRPNNARQTLSRARTWTQMRVFGAIL